MARTYHRDAKGRFTSNGAGTKSGPLSARKSASGPPISFIPGPFPKSVPAGRRGRSGSSAPPVASKIGAPKPITNISTGKPISREEAARIMFGSKGAAKKLAAGKKARKR